jgi:uncharacterized phage protein (TIGR01671 family)
MNRPIKFRAWGREEGRMYQDIVIDGIGTGLNERISTAQKVWELMQFTGLTDKNGKDVFEGDVVRFNEIHKDIGGKIVSIIFKNGCFVGDYLGEKLYDEDIEVIGNIYENPNLITK